MNHVFSFFILGGIIAAVFNGNIDFTTAAMSSASDAVQRAITLIGIVSLWLGIARVGRKSGLINILSHAIAPVFSWLFPSIPRSPGIRLHINEFKRKHAGSAMRLRLGLKAMKELQSINQDPDTASEAMCNF